MHLLGVFHPSLHTQEQREDFISKLRRVYETLRNKWAGDTTTWSTEEHQLSESIRRDAIRTDPTETFLAGTAGLEEDNLEKLVRITMIYTLEHPEVRYTQGMTDVLSPLLYVMEEEEDAYICFAALFTRLKDNFSQWCQGALNKLERLKHLCEVLDPELYSHLTINVTEDPFVLFFGMVLIECRREFTFKDSLHLLEVILAASFSRDKSKQKRAMPSVSEWAQYMTSESTEVILQVFGEISSPYAAHPLEQESERRRVATFGHTSSCLASGELSRSSHSSQARQIRRPDSLGMSSTIRAQPPFVSQNATAYSTQSTSVTVTARDRSVSLPNQTFSPLVEIQIEPMMTTAHSTGDLAAQARLEDAGEDELQDSVGDLRNSYIHERINNLPANAEMSDLSSVCSSKGSTGLIATSTNSSYTSSRGPRKHQTLASGRVPSDLAKPAVQCREVAENYHEKPAPSQIGVSDPPSRATESHRHVRVTRGFSTEEEKEEERGEEEEEEREKEKEEERGEEEEEEREEEDEEEREEEEEEKDYKLPDQKEETVHSESQCQAPPLDHLSPSSSTDLHRSESASAAAVVGNGRLPQETVREMELATVSSGMEATSNISETEDDQHRPPSPSSKEPHSLPTTSYLAGEVATLRGLEHPAPIHSDNPLPPAIRHRRRASSDSRLSPIPSFFEAMDRMRNQPNSLEASMEVSHVISQIVSMEMNRPNANRESSLRINISENYSLFVCLAILLQHRTEILEQQMDFVSLSVLLNSQSTSQELGLVLKLAKQLHYIYRHYQSIYFDDLGGSGLAWLDDDRAIISSWDVTHSATISLHRPSQYSDTSDLRTTTSTRHRN